MCEPQSSSSRYSTADFLVCGSDEKFFQSLSEFIEQEKRYVKCSEEGPDRLRHISYRSVFSKVIAQATAYKRLLLTIKAEYDGIIRMLQRREDEAGSVRRTLAASASRTASLITCLRRAAQLRQRISVLQRETAELQEEIKRQKSSKEQSTWIPDVDCDAKEDKISLRGQMSLKTGLTVVQSEDPEALDRHLQHLEAQRASLLDRRSHCVSLELKAKLDTKLQTAEHHRDQLRIENDRLTVL